MGTRSLVPCANMSVIAKLTKLMAHRCTSSSRRGVFVYVGGRMRRGGVTRDLWVWKGTLRGGIVWWAHSPPALPPAGRRPVGGGGVRGGVQMEPLEGVSRRGRPCRVQDPTVALRFHFHQQMAPAEDNAATKREMKAVGVTSPRLVFVVSPKICFKLITAVSRRAGARRV